MPILPGIPGISGLGMPNIDSIRQAVGSAKLPADVTGLSRPQQIEDSPFRSGNRIQSSGESFSDMLVRAIQSVDDTMKVSDQNVQDFITGETEDVHNVMISMQRAQLSFQLMVEIRNKAIETYQEISRMQI